MKATLVLFAATIACSHGFTIPSSTSPQRTSTALNGGFLDGGKKKTDIMQREVSVCWLGKYWKSLFLLIKMCVWRVCLTSRPNFFVFALSGRRHVGWWWRQFLGRRVESVCSKAQGGTQSGSPQGSDREGTSLHQKTNVHALAEEASTQTGSRAYTGATKTCWLQVSLGQVDTHLISLGLLQSFLNVLYIVILCVGSRV